MSALVSIGVGPSHYLNQWWINSPTHTRVTMYQYVKQISGQKDATIKKLKLPLYTLQSWGIIKFMGPTWGPPGSCRPQIGPMLAPWTLLSGYTSFVFSPVCPFGDHTVVWYRGAEQGTDKCFVIIHHSHASVTQGRVSFLMMSHVNPVRQNCGQPHQ